MPPVSDLPPLPTPAQRALAGVGVKKLKDLAGRDEADIADLHGMDPGAMRRLKAAMRKAGVAFAEEEGQ